MNQFMATAVAENLSAMNTAAWLTERKDRAAQAARRKILRLEGGVPPREGDERE
ncbi:MAG: hypothetical protein LT102_13615 [Burkholderiaceae bacterium]|nr:hypothetical protein [Burkholderiaceae bacterium]